MFVFFVSFKENPNSQYYSDYRKSKLIQTRADPCPDHTTCNVHFRKLERRANMTAAEATQSGDATVNDVNGPYYLG